MPFYILLILSLELLNVVTSQVAIPKSYLGTEVEVLCNMTMALPMLKKAKFPWNCTQAQQQIGSWCSWTGVTCAPNGGTGNTIITSIGLSKQKIAGSIPNAIGLLTTLQFLFLDQNALVGTIPSSIGRLTNLQTLHLENNYLSGTLPSSLTTLTNLVVLNVNNNYLTGTLATAFKTMGFTNDDYFGTAMTYNEMNKPTGQPTNKPTFGYRPSHPPTPKPSTPTGQPTQRPSGPTKTPTLAPTKTPTKSPTCMSTSYDPFHNLSDFILLCSYIRISCPTYSVPVLFSLLIPSILFRCLHVLMLYSILSFIIPVYLQWSRHDPLRCHTLGAPQ